MTQRVIRRLSGMTTAGAVADGLMRLEREQDAQIPVVIRRHWEKYGPLLVSLTLLEDVNTKELFIEISRDDGDDEEEDA
jgi:hypothetical protein